MMGPFTVYKLLFLNLMGMIHITSQTPNQPYCHKMDWVSKNALFAKQTPRLFVIHHPAKQNPSKLQDHFQDASCLRQASHCFKEAVYGCLFLEDFWQRASPLESFLLSTLKNVVADDSSRLEGLSSHLLL